MLYFLGSFPAPLGFFSLGVAFLVTLGGLGVVSLGTTGEDPSSSSTGSSSSSSSSGGKAGPATPDEDGVGVDEDGGGVRAWACWAATKSGLMRGFL